MKIVFISDTHGLHGYFKSLPDGDMIIHAGDISSTGTKNQVLNFLTWYSSLPYKYKIFIAGNHDFIFEKDPDFIKNNLPENLIYLENSEIIIENIKFYGSPISPFFHNWAFNVSRGPEIQKYWDMIPVDVNVLITHGPPYNILDKVNNTFHNVEQNVGCKDLKNHIFKLKDLKVMAFGHIHEAAGYTQIDDMLFFNASSVDEHYVMKHDPIVIEIDLVTKNVTFGELN
jgi:Icc-related predicted phosphoesterase